MVGDFVYIDINWCIRGDSLKKYEVGIVVKEENEVSYIQFVNMDNLIMVPNGHIHAFDPIKTGDRYGLKICNVCNRLLPTDCFQINQTGKGDRIVRRPSCNDCREIIDGKSVSKEDKDLWNLKKPYMEIWECPICKKRTIPGLTSKVVLDHNHKTGQPRAWICDSCNTGLGRFKDDIEVMERAIDYLKNN